LQRLVITQRQAARAHIFRRLAESLSANLQEKLEALLHATGETRTLFQLLKQPPGNVSPKAMARLAEKLTRIRQTGLLQVDLRWLNNNYQRSLAHYAHRCSADRLCQLQPERRYAVLSCFLWQLYRDTIDYMLEMHAKLVQGVYQRVQEEIDAHTRQQRRMLRHSLKTLRVLGHIILDERIQDTQVRTALFNQVERDKLVAQMEVVESWLTGKYSHVFHRVVQRFTYLRQFSPLLVDSLRFHQEEGASSSLVTAIELLHEMNHTGKRKLPDDAPMAFIPEHLRSFVEQAGEPSKQAWECALLTALRDDIRAGNVYVQDSKRFGRFADFFISDSQWAAQREGFFQRAGLPSTADAVPEYLTRRLNQAYDHFLEHLPDNTYASVDERGWRLSVDPPHTLNEAEQERVAALQRWLGDQMQEIKLPDLLIAVDNDLHFTRHFLPSTPTARPADQVCELLATIIAHGCNIGPYTMSRLAGDISYTQIKWVTDWLLTEEAQRQALAEVVNAISRLDISHIWGAGKRSSSDGQRFRFQRDLLQRTYSQRFREYAMEFYSFVADNYAPFYSTVIECTDRDAAYVLDGLLYNENDLALEEHATDTHGYTKINFAAFGMLGRRFVPRIRGRPHQRIYRVDATKDYGALTPLVGRWDRTINLAVICEQWDRMGQFYASLEHGHATASAALKRLVAYNGKNHFYCANRELGRLFKTEHILQYPSDPRMRQRIRRGLLKGEEVHALARQVAYGKQGSLTARDLHALQKTSSCLTMIMACIIYWQANEISRVVVEGNVDAAGVDLSLLEHVSPVRWDNVILYGQYILNHTLVRA